MANISHGDLTANEGNIHIVYEWTYADEAAREAADGFTTADVGKFARQLDDNSIWMLIDDDPETWIAVTTGGDLVNPMTTAGDII